MVWRLPGWHPLPSSTASAVTISQSSSALVNTLLQGGGSPEGVSAYETSIFWNHGKIIAVPMMYLYMARLATLHSCRQGWFFCPWQLPPPWRQPPCLVTPRGCNHILRNPCNCKSTKLHLFFYRESSLHDIEGPPGYEHIHHFFSVLIKPEPGETEWVSEWFLPKVFSPCQAWGEKRQHSYCWSTELSSKQHIVIVEKIVHDMKTHSGAVDMWFDMAPVCKVQHMGVRQSATLFPTFWEPKIPGRF